MSTASITSRKTLKAAPLKSGTRQRRHSVLFDIMFGILARAAGQEIELKGMHTSLVRNSEGPTAWDSYSFIETTACVLGWINYHTDFII